MYLQEKKKIAQYQGAKLDEMFLWSAIATQLN